MNIHKEKHFYGSLAMRDIVIGMSDGLTVPFALAAGLAGASLSNSIIITAGISELVAGAISMGLGGYLAAKSDIEHYSSELKRENSEIELIPEDEKSEIKGILHKFGISNGTQEQFVNELAADKNRWLQFMMEFELGLQKPEKSQVKWGAIRIGAAYAIGGLIPLLAYFLTNTPKTGLLLSATLTVVALAVFGYVKSSFLDQPRLNGTARMVLVGALAAAISYSVASLIS